MSRDPERMRAISAPHGTIADKIRALDAAGYPRADIARFLGKRYQHVRNVLEGDAQSSGGYVLGKADLSGVRDNGRPFEREDNDAYIDRRSPTAFWIEVKPDGTLPLPPELVDVLNAKPGERVFAKIKDGRVTLKSGEAADEDIQAIMAKHIKPGRLVSEELIKDRRSGKMWGD
ncbi:MAG TPA: AbrB/MazE/SpoVT family DNA-binding domain-containing protein [Caulobacteraceae bacterium]